MVLGLLQFFVILSKRTVTRNETRHITKFHPVFCVPDGKSIPVQLVSIAVQLEVNVKFPVPQFARLHTHTHIH